MQLDSDDLMAVELDLEDREPFDRLEHDGLTIRFYEVDDQLVLDFDYEPAGPWAHLDDSEVLKAFAQKLLDCLDEESAEIPLDPPESEPGCASGACPLPAGS